MPTGTPNLTPPPSAAPIQRGDRSLIESLGRRLLRLLLTVQGLGAFTLITLGVMATRLGSASTITFRLSMHHAYRAGLRLLPMIVFIALALGLAIIGQTVSLLTRVGADDFLGTIMVTIVVRELGPLATALVVLSRTGTANVIELGTARATGEVEALEALGIDPIHYLVVPRVIGISLGMLSLTIYLILGALVSGCLWAFVQDVPLRAEDYFRQIANALTGLDFVLLAAKTIFFGATIAIVTCYHGLARRLRLQEVSGATVQAVGQSVVICILLDTLFLIVYLIA